MKTALAVNLLVFCLALCMQYSASASIKRSTEDSDDRAKAQQAADEEQLKWDKHLRVGDKIVAKPEDLEEISSFFQEVRTKDDGATCFTSYSQEVTPEDGPVIPIEDLDDEKSDKSDSSSEDESYECLRDISKLSNEMYYYPEYAVGMLDNGCTAFLVGPHHALTLAKCVYDNEMNSLKDGLDFWRGRNRTHYLERMEWEEVYIPALYKQLSPESDEHNWALISFNKAQSSPVWLNFQYCPDKCPHPYVTTFGYFNEQLYRKDYCHVGEGQDCLKSMKMSCCHTQPITINGGPVVYGYGSKFSEKMPPIIGITMKSDESKIKNDPTEYAFMFDSDVFWSVCYFLAKSQGEALPWSVCKKL